MRVALRLVFEVKFGLIKEFERPIRDINRSWGFKDIEILVLLSNSWGLKVKESVLTETFAILEAVWFVKLYKDPLIFYPFIDKFPLKEVVFVKFYSLKLNSGMVIFAGI